LIVKQHPALFPKMQGEINFEINKLSFFGVFQALAFTTFQDISIGRD